MYISSPKLKNGNTIVRLVHSFREGGKVKKHIVKTIGQSKDPATIDQYKRVAQAFIEQHKEGNISFSLPKRRFIDVYKLQGKDRYNTGFEDIFGEVYKRLGFSQLITRGRNNKMLNDVLRYLVFARLFLPSSKLRSCRLLDEYFNKPISYKQIITMMEHLARNLDEVKEKAFGVLLKKEENGDILLFDVTTLYFESVNATELQDFGYSKDGKFNEVQIVLAVVANQVGLPLAYEVFSGNTGETTTFTAILERFVLRYQVERIRIMADRAMFSEHNFNFFGDLARRGIQADYVVCCPLKKLPREIKEKLFEFKRRCLKESTPLRDFYEFDYKGRRIIVSFSEKLKSWDESKRQKILDKISGLSSKEGVILASRLVKNRGLSKYLKKIRGKTQLDSKKVVEESLWDGLYGVCSNIEVEDPGHLLSLYRCLWKIEELFRINKHSLKMRPIYHRLPKRIKVHIFICFIAYTVLRKTEVILREAGVSYSPERLISILSKVESFIINEVIEPSDVYCIPRSLSEEAQKIYSIFSKSYLNTPCVLE